MRDGKRQAASAHTALNLVCDQERAVPVAGGANLAQEFVAQGECAREALYGLENDGGGFFIDKG